MIPSLVESDVELNDTYCNMQYTLQHVIHTATCNTHCNKRDTLSEATVTLISAVDLLDAHVQGGTKMELCHDNGGGRLLVDLQDARENGKPKMELCHRVGSRRRTLLT